MKCPFCGFEESKVIDSRPTDEGERIRRRRECISCGKRFTTYEIIETVPIVVVKKDKSREVFDRNKLFNSMLKACEKRPVSVSDIDELTRNIEMKAYASEQEITSAQIGEMVMESLRKLDEVAYVRFACVYHQFRDLQTFVDELGRLISENQGNADDEVR